MNRIDNIINVHLPSTIGTCQLNLESLKCYFLDFEEDLTEL